MKLKFLWPVLAVSLINPVCADTSMTQKALKPLIEYQCGQELKDSKVWKMGTYFMAEANKQHLQQKVCGCVGEHALEGVPAKTLLKATVDEETKKELTRKAIANSLKGCMGEFIN